jgi:spore coat polysaccharide biosynthesis protein SpsF
MNLTAIIQARMGSTRLPGKVLMDLCGKTVLARVVHRLQRASGIDEIVVATSSSTKDDFIVSECEHLDVSYFRGPEDDVLERYVHAAERSSSDAVVRITSDCPLIDPEIVDGVIQTFFEHRPDLACNDCPRTFPRGLDVEVFTAEALRLANAMAEQPYQREHVTALMYERPDVFRVHVLTGESHCARYRLTLDTPDDMQLLRAIYSHFGGRDDFGWREAIELLETTPDLAMLNAHVEQKSLWSAHPA